MDRTIAPAQAQTAPTPPVEARAQAVQAARRLADDACARTGITVVEAHDVVAARRVSDLFGLIWGRDGTQMLEPSLLVAMAHAGNLVAVAMVDGEPAGATAGFCGPPGTPFHSHIVGLLPHAVGRGRGRAVKLVQRAWCLEHGIDVMTWTFDPLVARNAYFNIRRLGAAAVEYLTDFYGEMTDAINAGQHSDRVLVRWDLAQEPPDADVAGPGDLDGAHAAVTDLGGPPSSYAPPHGRATCALVAVPTDIESLRRTDPDLARRWRVETRAALSHLLASGWAVTDFTRPTDRSGGQYVLRREGTP